MKSSTSPLTVFVYGTLKPGEANYHRYCKDQVRSQNPAFTTGDLYALPVGYPAMTVGENQVQGFLLTFIDPNILTSLDRLEGYQQQRKPDLNEYYRQLVPVYNFDYQSMGKAWAYFMSLQKVKQYGGTIISSGYWTGSNINSQ
ncbi:gamma-glutamylcyclotransferase [Pleurocapsa sp. PCC 7319]|uniref:gamma-glutamylcyclotransferase family protein n=1 Tax=Pleurocapsa sp. PCC 7319 TaxID=118161 RepID=UPI00034AE61F|nr:gamma-glutamylcyclotransferase [Pleurocapsa sp. PCC 7319]